MPRKKTLTCSTVPGNCRSPILDNPYAFSIALNSKGNPALTKPQAHVDVFPAQFDLRVRMCCKHSPERTCAPPRWLRLGSQRVINLLGAALLSPNEQPSGYSPTHATYAADFGTAQTNSLPALCAATLSCITRGTSPISVPGSRWPHQTVGSSRLEALSKLACSPSTPGPSQPAPQPPPARAAEHAARMYPVPSVRRGEAIIGTLET